MHVQAVIPDKERTVEYTGKVSGGALKKWALQQIPSHVSVLQTTEDMQQLMGACSMSQSPGAKGAGAAWAACAVLVSDSADVSALWKATSTRYRGTVCIGLQLGLSRCLSLLPWLVFFRVCSRPDSLRSLRPYTRLPVTSRAYLKELFALGCAVLNIQACKARIERI